MTTPESAHEPEPDIDDEFWAPRTDFPPRAAFDAALEEARRLGKKAHRR